MKPLAVRAASAFFAIGILFALYHLFRVNGFIFLCLFAVLLLSREAIGILFKPENSLFIKLIFFLSSLGVFGFSVLMPNLSALIFALFSLMFCSISILRSRQNSDLIALASMQSKSLLGIFYVGLLPSFACRILLLPNGLVWFLTLLAVVFAGDTAAYLTGMLLGKNKLMPSISPKKTIEGSIGGLIGSAIAGIIAKTYLPHISYAELITISLLAGFFGQLGDLFESLLKRVADKKDSGLLLPGHGGILDRLDGVLFAAPLILLAATILQNRL